MCEDGSLREWREHVLAVVVHEILRADVVRVVRVIHRVAVVVAASESASQVATTESALGSLSETRSARSGSLYAVFQAY